MVPKETGTLPGISCWGEAKASAAMGNGPSQRDFTQLSDLSDNLTDETEGQTMMGQ